jgi:hypothetical protein
MKLSKRYVRAGSHSGKVERSEKDWRSVDSQAARTRASDDPNFLNPNPMMRPNSKQQDNFAHLAKGAPRYFDQEEINSHG